MPHQRKRYLEAHLKKALTYSPIVGVLGQRQVGKTTLVESVVLQNYVTLDDVEKLDFARTRPKAFIESFQNFPTGIDECQKAPEVFPVLKDRLRSLKRPGQFILSGSVRFTSRKSIQESLTGRIINLELLPMSLAEMRHQPALDYFELFDGDFNQLKRRIFDRQSAIRSENLVRFMGFGGLPGIGFSRNRQFFGNKYRTHLETLLQRDLQFVYKSTAPYSSSLALLRYLALNQGKSFVLKEAASFARLAQNTVKRLIEAFEGLFLLRRVPGTDFVSSPHFYLEDQGCSSYLLKDAELKESFVPRFLFSQVFPNIHYTFLDSYQIGHFETKSGKKLPLVCTTSKGTLGFLYEPTEVISSKTHRLSEMFLSESKDRHLIILNASSSALKLEKNLIQMPLQWIV